MGGYRVLSGTVWEAAREHHATPLCAVPRKAMPYPTVPCRSAPSRAALRGIISLKCVYIYIDAPRTWVGKAL